MTTDNPQIPDSEKPVLKAKGRMILHRIRDFEQDGLSGRAMLKRLRSPEFGFKISDKEFWKTRQMAQSWQENARKAKFSRNDRIIPEASYALTPFKQSRARYQHILRINGKNEAGDKLQKFVTVSSDNRLNKNQIYAGAQAMIEADQNAYDGMIGDDVKVTIVELYQT